MPRRFSLGAITRAMSIRGNCASTEGPSAAAARRSQRNHSEVASSRILLETAKQMSHDMILLCAALLPRVCTLPEDAKDAERRERYDRITSGQWRLSCAAYTASRT